MKHNHQSDEYTVAAFYWPAYHDEPRWRAFMPAGEGEWETIRKAFPKFEGHYQPRVPLWGYEDESQPAAMERKIAAAAAHGVNAFIFDWYWYDNQPFLVECIDKGFLGAKNNDRISFYLMWANHDATTLWDLERSHKSGVIWPGAVDRATFDRVADRVISRYFSHPSYYRIKGCPVFSIYELSTLIKGLGSLEAARDALSSFRLKVKAAGFADLHMQAILWSRIPPTLSAVPGDRTETQANTLRALGFDSLTNYQWCHYVQPKGDYALWAESAMARWAQWAKEFSVPFFPHVSIGWDTNPRFKDFKENLVVNASPQAFAECLRKARQFVDLRAIEPRLITINSWNEWSEGSYLEPDRKFGMAYLEAVKQVFGARAERAGGDTPVSR